MVADVGLLLFLFPLMTDLSITLAGGLVAAFFCWINKEKKFSVKFDSFQSQFSKSELPNQI